MLTWTMYQVRNSLSMTELWNHQKKAVERMARKFALFFDPGTGKTRTTIEIFKRSGQSRLIVFAPLNVCRNWVNELKKYLPGEYAVFLCAGQTKAKKLQALIDYAASRTGVSILICNTESLRSSEYRKLLKLSKAGFVVVDESQMIKSPNSIQTKGLLELVRTIQPEYLYLLSGSPFPQGEIDCWSTFTLLGKTNDNFYIWRKKNFIDKNERRRGMNNYWPEYVISQKSRADFQTILAECSMVAKKNEVLDLPPLLRTTIYAGLSAEQKRYYETMTEYLFAIDSDGHELNASNMLVRTMRLQQILAGFLGDVAIFDNPRLMALDSAIELTNGEQFIIWTIFSATYSQIADRLERQGISFGMLTGEQSAEVRQANMDAFQAGKLRALIAHPKAGGVGVNLTQASYSIHYTRSYNLVDDMQCEARNYRGGSEIHKRITRIDIVAADTIDEEITEALKEKKSVMEFILGLKERSHEIHRN